MSREDGMPEPLTEHGHRAQIQEDRGRVVCTECPWFAWMPGASRDEMFAAIRRHKNATTLR